MRESVCIDVKVKPHQPEFQVRFEKNNIIVDLKSRPEKNEANIELIRMFTKILKKPVCLISGKKSKNKTIKIEHMTEKEVHEALKHIKN